MTIFKQRMQEDEWR